ncbi:unnamed protein product, partial [marine sediment metagenome]
MLQDIVEVKALQDYGLFLLFDDGIEGIVDIKDIIDFDGIFEPLKNPSYFSKVSINSEWGTVFWPNGADLDPDVLYSKLTGESIPKFELVE